MMIHDQTYIERAKARLLTRLLGATGVLCLAVSLTWIGYSVWSINHAQL